MADDAPLKLRAVDPDDLKVVSACLQDALVPLREVAWLKRQGRFILVANRFRWEQGELLNDEPEMPPEPTTPAGDARFADDASFTDDEGTAPPFQRTNCGLCFDRVNKVRFRGIDLASRHQILNLLAIEPVNSAIDLLFSEQAAIRLDVSGISCHLEDLGEPWLTRWRPKHTLDDEA